MMTISALFLAMTVGFNDEMMVPQATGYTVHFQSTTGYPVAATLTFATTAEANAFASMKESQGYAVRVTPAK